MSAPTTTPTTGIRERHSGAIEKIMSKYPIRRSGVMDVLYLVQDEQGWISPDVMPEIAEICDMEPSEVMEMVSFYTMYHRKPVGKHVLWVCGTLPCALCGSDGLMKYLQEKLGCGMDTVSPDGNFTIKRAECLGACSEAPLLLVDGQMQTHLTRAKVDDMIERLKSGKPLEKPAAASPDPGLAPGAKAAKPAPAKSAPVEAKVIEKPVEKKAEPEAAKPVVEEVKPTPVEPKVAEPVAAKVEEIASEKVVAEEKKPEPVAEVKLIEAEPVSAPAIAAPKEVVTVEHRELAVPGSKALVPDEHREVVHVEPREVAPVEPKTVAKSGAKQIVRKAQTVAPVGEDKKARPTQVVTKQPNRPTGPSKTVAVYRKPSSGEDAPPERPAPIEVGDSDTPVKRPRPAIIQKVLEKKSGTSQPAPLPKFSGSFADRVMATVKAKKSGEPPKEGPSLPKREKLDVKVAAPAKKVDAKKPAEKNKNADKGKPPVKNSGTKPTGKSGKPDNKKKKR